MNNYSTQRYLAVFFSALMILSFFAIMPATAATSSRTYTLDADFEEGTLIGLEHETVHDQLQLSEESVTLPFIWVPNSNEGTVSKYDTVTGKELGRFHTGPTSGGNPSRTTVDLDGNVWFGNRGTGTVVKIGLLENGQWVDRNENGVVDTSRDLNNDGKITGSEILPWGEDECMLYEVLLGSSNSGPRGIAIDSDSNLWAGTYNLNENKFYHIDRDTGEIIDEDTISIKGYSSYGAIIDSNGNIWSSCGPSNNRVLKIDPSTKNITPVNLNHYPYGLGIDKNGHLFVSGWGADRISKIDVNTASVLKYASQGDAFSRGVAVTDDGDVWVVNSNNCDLTRLDKDLNRKATIDLGTGVTSTGAAVDAEGKVWACNLNDGKIHRIDPATNEIDLSVQTPGMSGTNVGQHYSYSDMTGIIARTVTTKIGTWTADFDSEEADMPWGMVSWNGDEPEETAITVEVRSSNDGATWSGWETAENGIPLNSTPDGRYLQVKTTMQISSGDVSPVLYNLSVEVGNLPPVADAGPDQVVEQDSHAGASVTLDGTGSTDDGLLAPMEYTWTWGNGSATGANPEVILPLGTTSICLEVSDGQFSDADYVEITVQDTTPPEIIIRSEPIVLWSPNHKYNTIAVSDFVESVEDVCDALVSIEDVVISSVSSDEPEDIKGNGDGNTLEDIVIQDSQTVDLRAEREGKGNGRVYTINFKVTDQSFNTATGAFRIWVPHDQGAGSLAEDDGAVAGYIVENQ